MLDEEVRFEHVRKAPPLSKPIKRLENLLELGCTIGGGVGGFLLAKHGLNLGALGTFFIAFPGAAISAIAGAFVWDAIEKTIESIHEERYRRREEALDQKAKQEGAGVATLAYRGNRLECIIRPEYKETGHIFNTTINDIITHSPTLSYQPNRDNSLTFRFGIDNLKGNDGLIRREGTSTKEIESEYLRTIGEIFDEEENIKVQLFIEGKQTQIIISYTGEKYNQYYAKFSTLCSKAMESARGFKLVNNYKFG